VEGFVAVSTKQMEIVKKLAEDCCKYGNNNQNLGFVLGKASVEFGKSHSQMEIEREKLLKVLGEQVFEPLREMIMSAPLEDARLLTYRYQRIRQDMESQIADVMRKQLKSKESSGNAESKLSELRTTLAALGREATAAMEAVEAQQQQVTFDRLLAMVDAERTYHQTVADILNKLHDEMLLAKHHEESDSNYDEPSSEPSPEPKISSTPEPKISSTLVHSNSTLEDPAVPETSVPTRNGQEVHYVGEVIHPFDAQADGELSISVGDFVVVRQVSRNGWSEGECKGKAGWFPSAYVEQRDKAPASKVIEPGRLTA